MDKTLKNAADNNTAAFFSLVNHRFKFNLFLLKNLPAAWFSGVRIIDANEFSAIVSVPYKWLTRNPFRSTYFASLSMAAELSTGILAMAHIYKHKPSVAMLVTGIDGKFYKKAIGKTFFHCEMGDKIKATIASAVALNVSQEIRAYSVGKKHKG